MTSYNGTFLTTWRGNPPEELVDRLMDRLADYHVAVGGHAGRLDVIITYPAETLRQAVVTGLAIVEAAAAEVGLDIIGADVLPTPDFDERYGLQRMPDLLSVTEAAEVMGVSAARVRQLLDAGRLGGVKAGATWVVPRAVAEARAPAVAGADASVEEARDAAADRVQEAHVAARRRAETAADEVRAKAEERRARVRGRTEREADEV
ncbi:DNA binding domain-containing protein, excisionase family [Geodermatophilus pulveris]|uniref:DNA binding domain-containing protein, excisionase family n=1 Tax=Geodermatophilus pulveris TaxID=1564159 RepID=A0A239ESK6_9ACTN|nr:helix-turn-helix domain-containing protein [Geodermatophilus pulveris]SNS47617.1 DNA binding domain-containing protein, excisionase family [Geodermatophilus pulveris]